MRSYSYVLVALNRPGEAKLLDSLFPDLCFCDTVVQ